MVSPLIIGHRGASAYAPENTLAAFERAIALAADGVEFDVWAAQDGTLVVCHEARLAGKAISALSYSQILAIDPHIPTLDAVVQCCQGRVLMDVEIKATGYEPAVISQLEALPLETVVVTSFVPEVLRQVRSLNPTLRTGLLLRPETLATLSPTLNDCSQELGVSFVAPHWSLLDDAAFVANLPDLPLWVWTVNEPDLLIPLATNPRVAGLITDYPDLAKRWIQPV